VTQLIPYWVKIVYPNPSTLPSNLTYIFNISQTCEEIITANQLRSQLDNFLIRHKKSITADKQEEIREIFSKLSELLISTLISKHEIASKLELSEDLWQKFLDCNGINLQEANSANNNESSQTLP